LHASHGGRGRGEVEALFTSSSNGDPRTVDPHIEGPDAVSSGHARLRTRSGSQSLYRKTFATHRLTRSESVDREVQGVSTERCQNDAVCRHLIGSSSPAYGSFRNAAQRPGAVDAAFTRPVCWPPSRTTARPPRRHRRRPQHGPEKVDRPCERCRPCPRPGGPDRPRPDVEGADQDRRAQRAHRSPRRQRQRGQRGHQALLARRAGQPGYRQARAAGWHMPAKLGYQRLAVVAIDYGAGHEHADGFVKTFMEGGRQSDEKVLMPLRAIDVAPYITRIHSKAPELDAVVGILW